MSREAHVRFCERAGLRCSARLTQIQSAPAGGRFKPPQPSLPSAMLSPIRYVPQAAARRDRRGREGNPIA